MQNVTQLGNFTGLAENYSKFRPGYSNKILDDILTFSECDLSSIEFADVGAGTGIWTRQVANKINRSCYAVEPNDQMREAGIKDSKENNIFWSKGTAENTGLPSKHFNLVTMASSFHWANFDLAAKEFHRILIPGGTFSALWNPRYIESNPLLVSIEERLKQLVPHLKRVSSGRSGITNELYDRLKSCSFFKNVEYFESMDKVIQTREHYLGVWWSVNDIRVQAGEAVFKQFMAFVEDITYGVDKIETSYLTRAWAAKTTTSQ